MNDSIPAPPPCGECGGQWLRDLLHQHRTHCGRYAAETSTIERDHRTYAGIRPATDTERTIIEEHDYERPPEGLDHLIRYRHSGGLHTRDVLVGDEYGWDYARRTAAADTGN